MLPAVCKGGVTAAVERVRRLVESEPDKLGHLAWYAAHIEARREAELQHLGGTAYLDYAGAALYGRAQLEAASAVLLEGFLANPHTSARTAEVVARARAEVLELFGASEATHTLVFTSGATQALQLLGENFAWSRDSLYLYAEDNHTSVLGLRQYARRAGASCGTFPLQDVAHLQKGLDKVMPLGGGADDASASWPDEAASGPNLIAFPGESNFSGARSDLACISKLRDSRFRWRVLLDAAKLACSPGALNLGACPADFAVVSFYKLFGYPTGLGALIVRHDAATLLAPGSAPTGADGPAGAFGPSYFAGGCVSAVSATSGFAVPRPALSEWLERGTSHFLGIAILPSQMACMRRLGSAELRRKHALAVCREAYVRMQALRHRSGVPLCTIFGRHAEPRWWEVQGPTVAACFRYADGSVVPYGLVAEQASKRGILLRTGCHCNAGACMGSLNLQDKDVRYFFASGKVCGDDLGIIDGRATGVVRVSFGTYSTLEDVRRWIALLEEEFVDRLPSEADCESCKVVDTRRAQGSSHAVQPTAPGSSATLPRQPALRLAPLAAPELQGDAASTQDGGGRVVGLKVYPIKGCGPLRVRRWPLDPATGALFLDRRWCLAPSAAAERTAASSAASSAASAQRVRPLSAKQAPRLTQVRLSLRRRPGERLCLVLRAKGITEELELPLAREDTELLRRSGAEAEETEAEAGAAGESLPRVVGSNESRTPDGADETCEAEEAAEVAARWFEGLLALPRLRLVEAGGAAPGTGEAPEKHGHFANAPSTLLLVSTASLREFGRLCGLAVPAERFRANLEVDFAEPYLEAAWPVGAALRVGTLPFEAAGRCVRCQAVDVDPDDPSARGPSLLAALATAQPGGGGGKGPTFGTLLRPGRTALSGGGPSGGGVLGIGMRVAQVVGEA